MTPNDPMSAPCCQEILDRLHDYLNRRDLSVADRETVRRHLTDCPPCGDLAAFENALLDRLRQSAPCSCPEKLRARVRALLDLS
ncbi:MAG: zf-HC2 domain-containing protein [Elusimicrobia bacterium]|nr:zf-HC2 domain-containing protein [Elusimicrobiota bacterium]MBK7545934.1 zf-HC2 domain-containing protein [Elusimicrobiota bacterium]MBK7574810.1 zf-HC2 domain-containing protein [Elusimicrobiota bacterium]MBK7687539.1 zf-HC2 domain-containing protein [Elusimicrobiota bacterium]MBK8125544.1 zf-HC2 domain-containing protein [Elusimicrobiota bacterium]